MAHQKKDTSTQITNYIISMADSVASAMLSTLTDSIKVTLSTNTISRGQVRHQIATLNLTAHTTSILGRTYAQLLVYPDITHLNNTLLSLQLNQTKGLIGRPSDKIHWATTLLEHTNVLQAYEELLQEEQEDPHPDQSNRQHLEQTRIPTPPGQTPAKQTKGKDKMLPMTRQTLDPLKQMRQKQAADAK